MSLPEVTPPDFPPPYPAGEARFRPGAAVRVRRGDAPGHLRTPWYLRGRRGVVERLCGAFPNPEELAYRRETAPVPLYRVRFRMDELWGAAAECAADTVDVEVFEHWLEPVDAA